MDLRSNTRSSRSRSKTPFTMSGLEQEIVKENHVEHSISKSTRRSTTTIKTGNGSNTIDSINEEYNSNSRYIKPSSSKRTTRSAKFYKTSDYSSEEGENEVSSTRSISENERNRILEDARKAAENPSGITALGLYRKAKRYWDEYPKTDWTYSPFSKDRVEIAPGVVAMPNMSRRHISSYDKYTNTDSKSSYYSSMRPQALFSERTDTETTTLVTVVKKVVISILMFFIGTVYLSWRSVSYIYRSAHLMSLRLAKNIHRATSRVMLMDTWLLRKRRNGGKTAALMALCLVPLLLLAGWWILSSMGDNIYGTLFNSSSTYQPLASPPESILISEEIRSDNNIDANLDRKRGDPNAYSHESHAHEIASSLTKNQLETIANSVKADLNLKELMDQDEIINRLLNSESMHNIINNYITHSKTVEVNSDSELLGQLKHQQKIIDELTDKLHAMKLELNDIHKSEIDVDKLKLDIQKENVKRIDHLAFQLNRCCRRSINLESQIFKTFTSFLNNPDFLQRQEGLKNWLRSLFVARTVLEDRLSNVTTSLNSKFDSILETNSKFLMDQVTSRLNLELSQKYRTDEVIQGRAEGDISLTDQRIKEIVRDILKIYDADKTGLVDYAMEPMGGQVITTRCTESYHTGTAVVSVLGLPLWYPTSSPRTVITPGINPGKCWAFQNYPGLLVIKLMAPIKIEAFSLEHISKLLVPDGKIDSAPKDFEVYGLEHEEDRNGVKIGEYRYDINGESLQFFIAQKPDQVFEYIELRITSNHGNPNYTCLYRFRVHGNKQAKSS